MRRFLWLMLTISLLTTPVLAAEQTTPAAPAARQKTYMMQFYGLGLRHLLDLLFKDSDLSYVIIPRSLLDESVTVEAKQPVPWDKAFQLTLAATDLKYARLGNTYVFAKTPLTFSPPASEEEVRIDVDVNSAPLEEAVKDIFQQTPYTFVLSPRYHPSQPAVTLNLKEVPFSQAIQVLSLVANATVAKTDDKTYKIEPLGAAAADKPAPAPSQKTITLDFHGLALDHALGLWAEQSGVEYVTVPPGLGKRPITLDFGRMVPLDEALQIIVKAANLAYTRVGDTYVFADASGAPANEPRVTIDAKDAHLGDIFRMIFRGTRYSFTLGPGLESRKAPAFSLNDVPLTAALEALSQLANLKITREDNVFVVRARPTVTIEGQQIPMLGTIGVGGSTGGGGFGGGLGGGASFPTGSLSSDELVGLLQSRGTGSWVIPSPTHQPGSPIVDLVVTNASFRDAAAQIAKASGLTITVHASVPDSIRVNAKIYQVDAPWLLHMLTQQAHLALQQLPLGPNPTESEKRWGRFLITPQPELSITGVPKAASRSSGRPPTSSGGGGGGGRQQTPTPPEE